MVRLHLALCLGLLASSLGAEVPTPPDWALPGSPTHQQVPPPIDFHRPSVDFPGKLGLFEGQTDIGGPLVPGYARFDAEAGRYTVSSAGYNIWYQRDEFRFAWTRMSGDFSLVADLTFPEAEGYFDRKAVLILRQELTDDAKEIMAGLHGGGLIHLAYRPAKGAELKEACRMAAPEPAIKGKHIRLGLEKQGEGFRLWVSTGGEPMRPVGERTMLSFREPFYVGIGFCSHQPVTVDSAQFSHLVMAPSAGQVK